MEKKLPNGSAVLTLGILSIVLNCCIPLVGIVLAIIGLKKAKKDLSLYEAEPDAYSNYSQLNTGQILCYVGLALSILYILYFVFLIATGQFAETMEMYKSQMG